jgi:hypothetical protein
MLCEKRQRSKMKASGQFPKKQIQINHQLYDEAEELKEDPRFTPIDDEGEAEPELETAPLCIKPGKGPIIRKSDLLMEYPVLKPPEALQRPNSFQS